MLDANLAQGVGSMNHKLTLWSRALFAGVPRPVLGIE